MEQNHRNLITRNINLLLQPGMIHYEKILPFLLEKKIFTKPMIDDIDAEETEVHKLRKLLADLCTRGPLAFPKFIDILRLTQHNSAIEILLPDDDQYNLEQNIGTMDSRSEVDHCLAHPEVLEERRVKSGGTKKERSSSTIAKVRLAKIWIEGDDCYKMSSAPRGLCFILNNVDFTFERERREGSEENARNLKMIFTDLGYRVESHQNKTAEETMNLLRAFASKQEHRELDSCVVILMSHGVRKGIEGTDSKIVYYRDVYDLFNNVNCTALMDKPKIFIISACRGPVDFGAPIPPHRKVSFDGSPIPDPACDPRRPTWTDMFICYSSVEGCGTVRDPDYGSWFIHYLIAVLLNHAWNTDLYTMLQEVDNRMQKTVGENGERQSAEIVNRSFNKKLFFNPGLYQIAS